MKIKDLSIDSRGLIENISDLQNTESHPAYNQAEEQDYMERTAHEWQIEDPISPGSPLLTDFDCLILAMIAYDSLVKGLSKQAVLDVVNPYRDMFYRGRLKLKYPEHTTDPKYQDGLDEMLHVCGILDPSYDPISGTYASYAN